MVPSLSATSSPDRILLCCPREGKGKEKNGEPKRAERKLGEKAIKCSEMGKKETKRVK
jgi:hypothetical protein